MTPELGYQQPGDIGGPMDIGEGYRWNVPILSYSFDQSFMDFFGSNGVAAVESAIQVLNDLPRASDIVLTNYPFQSSRINWGAENPLLIDLKSATLYLLIEHLGLAQPVRNVFDLRRWSTVLVPADTNAFSDESSWVEGIIPNFIVERNFDPDTLLPSHWVDGKLYSGEVIYSAPGLSPTKVDPAFVSIFPVDGYSWYRISVADGFQYSLGGGWGQFWKGLTRDDVGGIRFLLRANEVRVEQLLPDVKGYADNERNYVNVAPRPGVEKLSFVHLDYDTQKMRLARKWKYRYSDSYLTNGIMAHQQLERITDQPDFLFSAADTGDGISWTPLFLRTGTATWVNNAAPNGDPSKAGPGVIVPPIHFTFHKLGVQVYSSDSPSDNPVPFDEGWGSFDESTNPIIRYPAGTFAGNSMLTVRLRLENQVPHQEQKVWSFKWQIPVAENGPAALQFSTNLTDWSTAAIVTNRGAIVDWYHSGTSSPQRFFRVLAL
jgi:hypothetical protein